MKILFPATHYYPVIGGIETWTTKIAEELCQKAEVFVVTGKVKGQPKQEIRNGVKVWRASLFTLKNLSHSPLFYTLTALDFISRKSFSLIKKEKIDLLHCNGFLSGLVGFSLSKLTGVPYIITIQSLQTKKGFFRKLVYRNAKSCIAASHAIAKYFEQIGCKNIEVIPNGIDISRFSEINKQASRQKLGLKDEFVVMTVARLEKVKGVDYLIKAFALLGHTMSESRLLVIGDGSERKNLEALVKELGLEQKVRFLGEIDNRDIPQYLAAADCFCLTSRREGFGIVVLEAQAAGLPVVAVNIGGLADLIESGKTGLLVEPENPEAIAKAIKEIHDQPELAKRLVENARASLGEYNWQNIAAKVLAIYHKIT